MQSHVIKIVNLYWWELEAVRFECLCLVNANFIFVLEHISLQITLKLTFILKAKKLKFSFHGDFNCSLKYFLRPYY